MGILSITLIIQCIIYLGMIYLIIGSISSKRIYKIFLYLLCSLFIWNISAILTSFSWNIVVALLFTKFAFISALFTTYYILLFSLNFPKGIYKKDNLLFYILFTINILISLLLLFTNWIIISNDSWIPSKGNIFLGGPAFIIFGILVISYLIASIYNFIRLYFVSKGLNLLKISYILLGTFIATILGVIIGIVLPSLGYTGEEHFLPYIPFITIIFYIYAIYENRLLSISFVITRIIQVLVMAAFVYGAFFATLFIERKFLHGVYSKESYLTGILIALFFVIIFIIIYEYLNTFLPSSSKYKSEITFNSFIKLINSAYTLDDIGKKSVSIISKEFFFKEMLMVIIYNDDPLYYSVNKTYSDEVSIEDITNMGTNVILTDELYIQEGASEVTSFQLSYLTKHKFSGYFPLIMNGTLLGGIFTGYKGGISALTVEDVNFLINISSQVSVLTQRIMLYEKSLSFSKDLKTKIDLATEDIKRKNKELEGLDKAKDDLLSIASHELRTPASIVKGNVYMAQLSLERLRKIDKTDKVEIEGIL